MIIFINFDHGITLCSTESKAIEESRRNPSLAKNNPTEFWQRVFGTTPFVKSSQEWLDLFTTVIGHGHKVVVLSFHHNPSDIRDYLLQVLKLPVEICENISIESWPPQNRDTAGKNAHILCASIKIGDRLHNLPTLLVDPSKNALDEAKKTGYYTITADAQGDHMKKILLYSERCKKSVVTSKTLELGNFTPLFQAEGRYNMPVNPINANNTNGANGNTSMSNEAELFPSFMTFSNNQTRYRLPALSHDYGLQKEDSSSVSDPVSDDESTESYGPPSPRG
jgi:hypothetical protein